MARTKYEDKDGFIHVIHMSAAKIAVANNTAPTAAVDSSTLVKVSKSNREYGIRPRQALLYRTVPLASPAVGEKVLTTKIPLLTIAAASATEWAIDATVTYNTFTWKVRSILPEDY